MKTTILGGALFLVPVTFLAIILSKAFDISAKLSKPVEVFYPTETVVGIAFADFAAIILILLVCFGAGLVARLSKNTGPVRRLDNFMIDILPNYAVAKGIVGGFAKTESAASVLRPVLVRFDDFDQMAFEVERQEDRVVLFVPGSPSAWSGTSVIVDAERVTPLDVPPHQITGMLRVMGRGSVKFALAAAKSSNPS